MTEKLRITILGCGGSCGVPLLGPNWGSCDPNEPRNRRRRASILIEQEGKRLLIDTGPDLRLQLLDAEIAHIDAVLYTHDHADHTHGIDDLRALCRAMGQGLDIYGEEQTIYGIETRFSYAMHPPDPKGTFHRPSLRPHIIEGHFQAAGFEIFAFAQKHGPKGSTGFRIGNFAYSTDVVGFSETSFACLAGISHWIVDCQEQNPHATHSHFSQTLGWIAHVQPQHAILTHLNETADYATLKAACPPGVEPAYDGMIVTVPM